jgi:hypothetical protein
MAYAPLVGQDVRSYGVDLPDGASEMFFADRLDGWNRNEIAGEISLSAQSQNERICPWLSWPGSTRQSIQHDFLEY